MDASAATSQKEWVVWRSDDALRGQLADELDIHPLVAHLLIQRGLTHPQRAREFLNPTLAQMHDPFLMKGMDEAVMIVLRALEHSERIVIHGDYDVDGISSASVLYEFLRDIGASEDLISYFIPRRDKEGYGLNIETIRRLQHEGCELLITTDCGVSNVDEITVAKALGLKVVVVDHHTVPEVLPPADAILNPLRPGCQFPFKKLAAVGVAFNFVVALRAALRERGVFKAGYVPEPDLRNYLDLVALGTIADVVPLVDENRLFARFGLDVLSKRRRAGISALVERACHNLKQATTQTVSFQLAPRLNAAGRMGDASICVELLTTRSYARAVKLAGDLEELNRARQVTERVIMREALPQAEEQAALSRPILIIVGEGWSRGVLGIVASRMMERYGRPAILIGVEDGVGKGSARSTAGVNLIAALDEVADLLQTYGGHTSAAGVALSAKHIDEFRTRLPGIVAHQMEGGEVPTPTIDIDSQISFGDLDQRMIQDMMLLSPFGMGNPEPVFLCAPARSSRARVVGKRHLRARFHDDQRAIDGIGFSMSESRDLLERPVAVAFVPKVSSRKGRERLEMHIKDLRPAHADYPDRIEDIETGAGDAPTKAPAPAEAAPEARPSSGEPAPKAPASSPPAPQNEAEDAPTPDAPPRRADSGDARQEGVS